MARNVIRGVCALAVISLILMINWPIAEANILVLDQDNRTIHKIEHLYEARFGKAIPEEGVWGHIAYTLLVPNDGCNKIEAPPTTSTDWIAVIKRGNCDFDIKVLHAQDAGYLAAIVFNNESDNLVPMGGGSKADLVNIPSVFIGRTDAEFLIDNFDRNVDYAILMDDATPFSLELYLIPFAIVMSVCFIMMIVFFVSTHHHTEEKQGGEERGVHKVNTSDSCLKRMFCVLCPVLTALHAKDPSVVLTYPSLLSHLHLCVQGGRALRQL